MENNKNCSHNYEEEKNESIELYQSVETAIDKIAEREGYIHHKIYKRTISSEGGNYLGVLYEVNIAGDTIEGEKETSLFVKHVLSSNDNMKIVSLSEIYSKEVFFYTELAKIFTELQNEVEIPEEDRFKTVESYDESTVDAIILDNISKKGFTTYSRMDIMSLKYAELSVQQLARFHGLSFVIEKRMPEYFQTKIKPLKQSVVFDEFYEALIDKFYDLSSKNLDFDTKAKTDRFMNTLYKKYQKYLQGTMTNIKCLCHGDYKNNNVLFKEIEGEVTEVIPVDYQLIYYGAPIIDFIYFLFSGTDREFRKKHLSSLKDLYHKSLKKFLEYFDIPVEEVYPREAMESDFENCLDFGLMIGMILLPFMFTKKNDTPDLGKDNLNTLSLTLEDNFYDRFQGIVDDFIEWGYL